MSPLASATKPSLAKSSSAREFGRPSRRPSRSSLSANLRLRGFAALWWRTTSWSHALPRRLRQVDSPGICILYDFPKKVHYPVSCYRDGGKNADGAEPAAGRAKQHLSESTDTKTTYSSPTILMISASPG